MRARHAARQRGEFEAADRLKHAAEASGFRLRDCGSWTWWESKERIRIPWAYCPRPFWYGWVGVRLRQAFRTGFLLSAQQWIAEGAPAPSRMES